MRTLRGPGLALPRTGITILAKAPVAGFAKTRLIPALGPEGAARVATQLLDHTVREAVAADLGAVRLLGAPDATHPAFQAHAGACASARSRVATWPAHALGTDGRADWLHPLALLVAPTRLRSIVSGCAARPGAAAARRGVRARARRRLCLDWPAQAELARTLRGHDLEHGPRDGRHPRAAAAPGPSWHELPAVSDIDEPADLVHVPAEWLA